LAGTPDYKRSQRARYKVEALFAELKQQIRLRRVRLRRLWNVAEQFHLAATAQNLKRLVGYLARNQASELGSTVKVFGKRTGLRRSNLENRPSTEPQIPPATLSSNVYLIFQQTHMFVGSDIRKSRPYRISYLQLTARAGFWATAEQAHKKSTPQ
jgi:Transposase DDE domain/Domain of unknown function (DUF4461)